MRSLGFKCVYGEKVWVLGWASPETEAAFRFLLETGELPEPGSKAMGAEASTPASQERKRARDAGERG